MPQENITLGQFLKAKRLEKGVKLGKVSQALNVPEKFLVGLENGDQQKLPEEIYAKNILKNYCRYLGFDYWRLKDKYGQSFVKKDKYKNYHHKATARDFIKFDSLLKKFFLTVLLLGLAVYLIYALYQIFSPPELTITFPPDNYITGKAYLEIQGRTEPDAELFVNQQPIFLNQTGEFKVTIDLNQGVNLIDINAKKKYSRERQKYLQVIVNR